MDDQGREKLHISHTPERPSVREKTEPSEQKEIGKQAAEVVQGEEIIEAQEGVEVEGRISEEVGEDKAHAPGAGGPPRYSTDEIEAIRAKLLSALPPQDIMIRQIRKKLIKEEKTLVKRMKKLKRKAHKQAFQLTIVIAQLRKLKEYFAILAHATYEMIKNLWLKIVHGV